jgi:hypothetical protein
MRAYALIIAVALNGINVAARAQQECPAPANTIDCTPTRDCAQPHDVRNCSACIVKNPFTGGCMVRGNDPACEAAKASQNQVYAAQKASCEAQKSAEKLACEAAKAAVEAQIARCSK